MRCLKRRTAGTCRRACTRQQIIQRTGEAQVIVCDGQTSQRHIAVVRDGKGEHFAIADTCERPVGGSLHNADGRDLCGASDNSRIGLGRWRGDPCGHFGCNGCRVRDLTGVNIHLLDGIAGGTGCICRARRDDRDRTADRRAKERIGHQHVGQCHIAGVGYSEGEVNGFTNGGERRGGLFFEGKRRRTDGAGYCFSIRRGRDICCAGGGKVHHLTCIHIGLRRCIGERTACIRHTRRDGRDQTGKRGIKRVCHGDVGHRLRAGVFNGNRVTDNLAHCGEGCFVCDFVDGQRFDRSQRIDRCRAVVCGGQLRALRRHCDGGCRVHDALGIHIGLSDRIGPRTAGRRQGCDICQNAGERRDQRIRDCHAGQRHVAGVGDLEGVGQAFIQRGVGCRTCFGEGHCRCGNNRNRCFARIRLNGDRLALIAEREAGGGGVHHLARVQFGLCHAGARATTGKAFAGI